MRPWSSTGLVLVGLMVLANRQASAAGVEVDAAVKPYEPVSGIAGNLSSIGSDTLNNLMTFWAEGFRKRYPNVNVQIEGKGSATAPRGHAFAPIFLISPRPVRSIGATVRGLHETENSRNSNRELSSAQSSPNTRVDNGCGIAGFSGQEGRPAVARPRGTLEMNHQVECRKGGVGRKPGTFASGVRRFAFDRIRFNFFSERVTR
jgi:hypothetical protein